MGCGCGKSKNKTEKPYTIVDVIKDELLGRAEKVDEETYRERILTCSDCPKIITPTFQCGKCLCFIRRKARYAKSQCPLTIEEDREPPRWLSVSKEDGPNPMMEKE
jgi:hypothetical protein